MCRHRVSDVPQVFADQVQVRPDRSGSYANDCHQFLFSTQAMVKEKETVSQGQIISEPNQNQITSSIDQNQNQIKFNKSDRLESNQHHHLS